MEERDRDQYPQWWFEIHSLKKEWDALQPLSKEAEEKLWKKFRLEWNYNSNHIEGNTLTYSETELLIIFDKVSGDHEARELEEMKAHDAAIKLVETWALDKNRDLTESDIRTLNKIILVKPFWKEAITPQGQPTRREIKIGEYKEHPNSVRLKNGEMFHYASPHDTPIMMGELMKWMKVEMAAPLNPLVLASQFHHKFVTIHPFDDGNGRIARLLMNYFLIRNEYPPIIIKSADKENYLTALQKADAKDEDALNTYMAKQLIWSLDISILAAKGEDIEEVDDVEKEISLWKKELSGKLDAIPKSMPEILNVYNHGIRQLFEQYSSKMNNSFAEVFNKINFYVILDGWGSTEAPFDFIEEALKTKKELNVLIFNMEFTHFKKNGKDTFNYGSSIEVEFLDFSYKVKYYGQLKEYLYTQFLSNESVREIISLCLKIALEGIRAKTKNK